MSRKEYERQRLTTESVMAGLAPRRYVMAA
jgi:hypothetical protein